MEASTKYLPRVERDFYPTPDRLIQSYLSLGHPNRPNIDMLDSILEPCCGDGAILNPLRERFANVKGTDITMGDRYDATKQSYWTDCCDWVISNPPFNCAVDIINNALLNSRKGVIMLLRASFLEPCKNRRHLLNGKISHITYVNPRPRFRTDTDGTDSSTVIFIAWAKKKVTPQINFLTDWHQ